MGILQMGMSFGKIDEVNAKNGTHTMDKIYLCPCSYSNAIIAIIPFILTTRIATIAGQRWVFFLKRWKCLP